MGTKLISLLTILISLLFLNGCESTRLDSAIQQPSDALNKDAISATRAAAEMGTGFNLGQKFESTQHPPTFASSKAKIDAYYARGYRNVRIPITWTEKIHGSYLAYPDTGIIKLKHKRLAQITQVIDYALSLADMYVVINAHHEKELKDRMKSDVLETLWEGISTLYSNRDYRLLFEVLNEPHLNNKEPMPESALRDMTQKAYNKIRARDPKRIIIIGGNQWFGAAEMAKTWPTLAQVGNGNDKYLMATFHHYNPWEFHGEEQGDYMDNWTAKHIQEPIQIMQEWAQSVGQGMPVYIGEWGTSWQSRYPTMQCNNIRKWYSEFVQDNTIPAQMPTAVWDDGGWFMIFDHQTEQFNNNLIDCIDGECKWNGEKRMNEGCE